MENQKFDNDRDKLLWNVWMTLIQIKDELNELKEMKKWQIEKMKTEELELRERGEMIE